MSLEHGLAAIAEARRLDRSRPGGATKLVDDQRRRGPPRHVLGDDEQAAFGR